MSLLSTLLKRLIVTQQSGQERTQGHPTTPNEMKSSAKGLRLHAQSWKRSSSSKICASVFTCVALNFVTLFVPDSTDADTAARTGFTGSGGDTVRRAEVGLECQANPNFQRT
jgi:hypothetical protein